MKKKYAFLTKDNRVQKSILLIVMFVAMLTLCETVVWQEIEDNSATLNTKLSAAEKQAVVAKNADATIASLKQKIQDLTSGEYKDKITELNQSLDVPTILRIMENSSQTSLLSINSYAFSGNAATVKGTLKNGDSGAMDDTAKGLVSSESSSSASSASSQPEKSNVDKSAQGKTSRSYYVLEIAMGYDSTYAGLYNFSKALEDAGYYFTVRQVSATTGTDGKSALTGKLVVDFYSLTEPKFRDVSYDGKVRSQASSNSYVESEVGTLADLNSSSSANTASSGVNSSPSSSSSNTSSEAAKN